MKVRSWRRLEELFSRAQELETQERAPFLERSCGGDRELRDELEEMGAADGEESDPEIESRLHPRMWHPRMCAWHLARETAPCGVAVRLSELEYLPHT